MIKSEKSILEIKNEIWNTQIGKNVNIGKDFSGRVIHKNDYENYDSPYGWSLINFGDDEYLIANIDSKREFPKNITERENEEFIVNNKIFSVKKNSTGQWDINLIEYKSHNVDNNENKDIIFETDELNTKNDDVDSQDFIKQQEKEIKTLELQLSHLKENNQNIQIEKNNEKLRKLRNEIRKTKELNLMQKNTIEDDYLYHDYTYSNDDDFDSTTIFQDKYPNNNVTTNYNTNTNDFYSNNVIQQLTKRLNEQTLQLERLRLDEKINQMKLENLEYMDTKEINNNIKNNNINNNINNNNINNIDYNQNSGLHNLALKQWEVQFGDKNFGIDFANKIVLKDKFASNVEGGWNIDYFDENSSSIYIASTLSIEKRAGRKKFVIENNEYNIINNGDDKWEIVATPLNGINFNYSTKKITNIASIIKPNQNAVFNGYYETYSSLLINLENFPLIYISKFEQFLKDSLKDLSIFKDVFIYSNENLYRNNLSDISCYARIFFKTPSAKKEIEVLMVSISLKKGLLKFVDNFRHISENKQLIYFSMFLYNHQKRLKFVQAETNFELLKHHPIPLRIPKNTLIIDSEYNATLKFHENNLWKKLKPYSLDYNGNVYYICNIDFDKIDVTFDNEYDNYFKK